MQRDEQIGPTLARQRHALGERQEGIVLTGQERLYPFFLVQMLHHGLGEGECNILFLDLGRDPGRSGIDTAMAGIDCHNE